MKLGTKISLAIVPLISIPLLIVGIYGYLTLWQVNTSHSKAQIEDHLSQLYDDYQSKVYFAHFALKSMANGLLMSQYMRIEKEEDRYNLMYKPMYTRLKSMQLANPNLYEVRLIMPDGYEELRVVNGSIPNATDDESGSEYFSQLEFGSKGYNQYVGVNPDTEKLALYVTIPVIIRDRATETFTSEPKVKGYLSVTQNINRQTEARLPAPWQKGMLLLSGSGGGEPSQIYSEQGGQHRVTKQEIDLLTHLKLNQWQEVNILGEKMHHIASPLNSSTWLHALIPNSSLLGASSKLSYFILLLSAVAISASILLAMFVLNSQILSRIANLSRAVKKLNSERKITVIDKRYNDEIGELIGEFNKMSAELHHSSERIQNLAYLDSLTALPNRFMFHKTLDRVAKQAERDNCVVALLYLDLDNFKNVNDNMGHLTGDHLLQQVANRLRECLRAEDTLSRVNPTDPSDNLSRLGGDEFTILIPRLNAPHHARSISKRILSSLSEPIVIDEHVFYVSASIGIALWPNDTRDTEELVAFADQAMYQAKNSGKNKYKYFSPEIGMMTKERATLEQHLYRAIDESSFTLHYQPIVDSENHKIQSFEALIRWQSATLGNISPAKFIPIAEENGSIIRIGEWVLEEVCRQINRWKSEGLDEFKVGVNLSAQQITSVQVTNTIQSILSRHGICPENIYFELTESSVIKSEENAIRNIERLRGGGYQIALDDFGTGYSSLSYLQKLPIDILKIDRSFISNISDGVNAEIFKGIVDVARALKLQVVAEGIEEQEQLEFLPKEQGVMIQGFLFSRPCPIDDAVKLLQRQRAVSEHIWSI
ncbi:EAL domain-containing protein [Vibrio sp. JC009]|uniref:putative bifunctional diguanylate cyclase/phosphodiesterase n=1 Tax=Vibrio sp. JC009 TaxID=2912314 RepID=UPI0023B00A26|nr:EAL domain-containing protein [Vibrio sp. JC009]WED24919.1 EAL domain-containing protein [Vibrio sp. JC009]